MNADIRVHTTFPHHHKTKKLRRKLGADGVLSLLYLWLFAAENRPSGVLTGMDPDDIAIACQWDGDATSMLRALLEVGFLELEDGVYALHDWLENNPWAAAAPARKAKASAAARARWKKRNEVDDGASGIPSDARSIDSGASSNAPPPTPTPNPSPTPSPSLKPATCEDDPPPPLSQSERMIRECVKERAGFIAEHFPDLDLVLETEELVAKYGRQSIGADPWLIVLRWLRNKKEASNGKPRPGGGGGAALAAAEAAERGGAVDDDFFSRPLSD